MSCLDSPINCKKKTSECLHVGKFVGALDGYRVGTLVGTSENKQNTTSHTFSNKFFFRKNIL